MTTQNIRGDYLGVVGSAAQLDLVEDGQEVAWHLLTSPPLMRAGLSPWRVRLDRLESSTVQRLGLRRAGADPVAWMGIALLFIGLLARTVRRRDVMTPIMLSALGAFVLLLVWSLTLSRVLVARIACVTAMAVSLHLAVSGNMFDRDADLMAPITLAGIDTATGQPVYIDVVLKGEGREARSVRRVPISTSVSGGPWSATLLFGLGLLGLISARRDDDRMALFSLGATAVGALLVLGVAMTIPSGGRG